MKNMKKNIRTKANTLLYLKPKIKNSIIEKIFVFTVFEWTNNKTKIENEIRRRFNSTIVIRSSAIGEDSSEFSQAGNYASILGIRSQSKKEISNAIKDVIKSYYDKENTDQNNHILVQNQTKNIVSSGVVFTRTNELGSPYYVINYDNSKSTDSVTQGKIGNTIKISRFAKSSTIPKKWRKLIVAIREIEKILNTTFLDIEFGIKKSNKIIIFQARPLTTIKNRENIDSKIQKLIIKNKKKFLKITKAKDRAKKNIFSDMADWNPSEIIGTNPNPLDYSLYDYLIIQKSWNLGRKTIGYQNVQTQSLMIQFGNKPYVDINASFNSLIPEKINSKIKRKLMKFYIKKLKNNPELHDKVEFEIVFTCYDLLVKNRLQELKKYGFDNNEINTIHEILLDFTNEIIQRFPDILQNSIINMNTMKVKRKKIFNELKKHKKNYNILLEAAGKLLKNCRRYGTVDFACMARIAFMSTGILKSLVQLEHLKANTYEQIMSSIETPVSDIQKDYELLGKKKLKKNEFLKKYGHLRPGTYDITQLRYDMNNPFFENIKFLKKETAHTSIPNLEFLEKIFKKHSLNFQNTDFYFFIKQSISQREYLKFEFTKNLSDALELIAEACKILGFSRSDISYLNIKFILNSYKKYEKKEIASLWKKKIEKQTRLKSINNYLVLPPLITSDNDFDYYIYNVAKPNFVTSKSLVSNVEYLVNNTNIPDLEDKIVLLKNADPGYDWIFTKNLGGLITKYGGSASHMAIRCAELGIPAAIGCGELIFENLLGSSKIMLDCKNQQIIILEKEKSDELVEVKKTLKSLGYIK